MTVQDKVNEASFFLSKTKSTDYRSEEKLHYLFAFLASVRGILENTILYDYASKYGLSVTLEDYLDISRFRDLATGNQQALNFINWFQKEMAKLSADPYWSTLGSKRNIVVHRGRPGLQHNIHAYATMGLSASVVVRDPDGNIVSQTPPSPAPQSPPPRRNPEYSISFQEFPSETIDDSCENLFNVINGLVQRTTTQFP
jgi:hypothetical protein